MTLRFLTGGESHGRGLLTLVEGLPSGLNLDRAVLSAELARRRRGFGRGPRMKLERDALAVWCGVRDGVTTGAPVGMVLENTEWESWKDVLDPVSVDPEAAAAKSATRPRPGHADLAGALKYGHRDLRNVLERASARQTAAWTLAGTTARVLLAALGVKVCGAVVSIGTETVPPPESEEEWDRAGAADLGVSRRDDEDRLTRIIRAAAEEGDTLGGTFLIRLTGLPPGIGSYAEADRRLDGRFAAALMSIPGIKGVEVGAGFRLARLPGSLAHDEIVLRDGKPVRSTNRAGGLEGGMTNGEDVLIGAAMKPIPTLRKPLRSVDFASGLEASAHFERSDACAVPAACVVGEAMAAWVAAGAVMEQFGGDTLEESVERMAAYRKRVGGFFDGTCG
ncbi:MAG: chorismate synthase [Synergistales bacterium]